MPTIETIAAFLDRFAPHRLAETWDNVGLLVGDPRREVRNVMTCLTITPDSAAEAIERQAELIVAHHPLPFTAVKRLTAETTVGRLLLELIASRTAVHSPHTAFDSAADGINQRLAAGLGLRGIAALVPHPEGQGAGRYGWLEEPLSLAALAQRVKTFLGVPGLHLVGQAERSVRVVAVACGAAGEFLEAARKAGCDCLVTGETRFHTCLEAEATGVALVLPGHFASERFAVEFLAEILARQFPEVQVWASRQERDPLKWVE